MPATVPVIDLAPWFDGGPQDRAGVARHVDEALRSSGFLLITGHRVPAAARAQTRAAAREFFAPFLDHPTYGVNLNWYPPADPGRPPEPGQYRIGPHTDFGTVTVLDREPGRGGLQIYTLDGTWMDAPYDPAALTVNIGDLLARWTGDRWRSTRHRVLPPQAEAPDEDLLSLIFFYEANHDAVVESLPAPIGRTSFPPVIAHEYIGAKLDAIGVT